MDIKSQFLLSKVVNINMLQQRQINMYAFQCKQVTFNKICISERKRILNKSNELPRRRGVGELTP